MIETITRKVAPQDEQQTIDIMTAFGWSLMSSQEINNTDSHLERRYDAIYSVTTKENYVKLLFKRDTGRRNYAKIAQLEQAYHTILNAQPVVPQGRLTLSVVVSILTIGLFMIPGILMFIHYKKQYRKKLEAWQQVMSTKGRAILTEVQKLL